MKDLFFVFSRREKIKNIPNMRKILLSLIIVLTVNVFAFAQDGACKDDNAQYNTSIIANAEDTPSGEVDALLRHKKPKLRIALFAAVPQEVGSGADRFHFTGIGRENATRTMLAFARKHQGEDLVIVNAGTVGSPKFPVNTIVSVNEIISAGTMFNDFEMRPRHFEVPVAQELPLATLYSSDCFVSPDVFNPAYLDTLKAHSQCFDMESSALFSVADIYGIPYYSFKIVSDNLDVPFSVWEERVGSLSQKLTAYLEQLFNELGESFEVEFVK